MFVSARIDGRQHASRSEFCYAMHASGLEDDTQLNDVALVDNESKQDVKITAESVIYNNAINQPSEDMTSVSLAGEGTDQPAIH
ncbi:hypothetical protein WA026_023729 [Henosepilachna vigintioctopunctata]|uniref:Uncharacterized protein n=1 Tax=Henosepilachna vigintioctopunctata TaxID=420089 RepID=A0AAW1UYY7_9CUCU